MKIPELIETQKHIFGTYAAMALKNIQIVLDHVQNITNITDINPEHGPEDLWKHPVMQYLDRNNPHQHPETTDIIIERLLRNFPFLKIMADMQREYDNKRNNTSRIEINCQDVYLVLNNTFRVLKKYRDYTLHYIMIDNSFDDNSNFLKYNETPLSFTINSYYTAALRNIKERYSYTTSDLAFIQDNRINRKTKKTDFNFFLSMQSFNNDTTKKIHLSGVGVVQLICLFLEKKYINIFISKLPIYGQYTEPSKECRVIRRSLSINSIVLPKERIQSHKKEYSIALDMLNELKRCPKELFEVLSQEDQDRFRAMSSDFNEVLHMRSADRFAQYSLQYIDHNKLFNGIKFHVNMGKLRYLFSPDKKCIDGEVRVRVLEHKLNGYGRIAEMEDYRKQRETTYGDTNISIRDFENVKRDDSNAENYPYIVDTYTHYILENNKIELFFSNNNVVPRVVKTSDGKWYVEKEPPHCRLSTLELPAMMFHMHLLGSAKTEKRIKSVYNNYIRLFKALSEGALTQGNIDSFNIPRCDIPQKVLDAVSGEDKTQSWRAHAAKKIDELLQETERLIKNFKDSKKTIESGNNKIGTRFYRRISSGKLADFLARDIVKFQPSQKDGYDYGIDRLTGLNYRVMQASIAIYNNGDNADNFQEFYNMFKEAKLVDNNNAQSHPFLRKALLRRPKNAVDFYEGYLFARKKYLLEISEKLKNGEQISLPFFNKDKNKWSKRNNDFYQIMGEIYGEDTPVELPRQMFDSEIKDALKAMPQMSDVDFDNANVTYLIGEYLKRVLDDDFQEFYNWKRNYRYIDLLVCDVNSKDSINKQYLSTTEREEVWTNRKECSEKYSIWAYKKKQSDFKLRRLSDSEYETIIANRLSACRNDFQKSEKHIRRYKVQDALMFLMVKDSLTKNLDFEANDFKLYDIMPDAEKGILSETMPMDFVFERKGKVYTIKSNGLKLKNYGDFFALAHDKRITSLLDIINSNTIDKEDIELELDNYDTSRPEVVRLVLDFEKYVYAKYPELKNKAMQQDHFDFLAILIELLKKGDLTNDEKVVLQKIRNSFSHNSYPDRGVVEIRTLPNIAKSLIDTFGKHVKKIKS